MEALLRSKCEIRDWGKIRLMIFILNDKPLMINYRLQKSFFFCVKIRMKDDVLNILQIALLSQIGKKLENLHLASGSDDDEEDITTETRGLYYTYAFTNWNIDEYIKECSLYGPMFYSTENSVFDIALDKKYFHRASNDNIILGDRYAYVNDNSIIIGYDTIPLGEVIKYELSLDKEEKIESVRYIYSIEDINNITLYFVFKTNKRCSCLEVSISERKATEHPINITESDIRSLQLCQEGYVIIQNTLYHIDVDKYSLEKLQTADAVKRLLSSTNIQFIYCGENHAIYRYTDKDTWGYYVKGVGKEISNSVIHSINVDGIYIYITATSGFYTIDHNNGDIVKYEFTYNGSKIDSKKFVMFLGPNTILNHNGTVYTATPPTVA